MASSSAVSAGDTVLESQYNNLRTDALHFAMVFKTGGDEAVSSSTTMQNDDDLAIAVAANTKYFFMANIRHSAANNTPDLDFTFTGPSGATGHFLDVGSFGNISSQSVFTALGTERGPKPCSTLEDNTVIMGYIEVAGTAGNLQFQWAQNISDAGATTVHSESHLMIWKVQAF